ncbi:ArsR family transcriptional regulator [Aliiroseovarius lamellibrachiae]|uniref:arsenate reductase/protein-tyrosine-phosphatase family protein n=1 Tax=Aliiroseovarius lamellibrachiae TaxID=1924933 RepID=UPI0031B83793
MEQITRLTTLGHPGRMAAYRLLVRRYPDYVASGDLAKALGFKLNTMSVYLGALHRAGLIEQKRDGRSLLYRFDQDGADSLVGYLFDDCCRGRPSRCIPSQGALDRLEPRPSVLFLCTGNSARSIFAEVILRELAGDRFEVYSAGTKPAVALNPTALQMLRDKGHNVAGLQPKHVSALNGTRFDFVFTVCDRAANEECATWPGVPISAHWGLPDPVRTTGTDAEKNLSYQRVYGELHRRLTQFAALDLSALDRLSLQHQLDEIPLIGDPE